MPIITAQINAYPLPFLIFFLAAPSAAFTRICKNPGNGQVLAVRGLLDQVLVFAGLLRLRAINGA